MIVGVTLNKILIHAAIALISATVDSKALQNLSGIQFSLNGGHGMILHKRRRRETFDTKEGMPDQRNEI